VGAGLATVILIASLPSFVTIPFMGPWPLDFQNLWAFHDCVSRNSPYASSGAACGDALGRGMYYPPLLYWAFAWTRWFTFSAASHVWTLAIAIGTALATLAWVPRSSWGGNGSLWTGLFVGLLLAQFPTLFALERGNNDVVVLVLWTIASLLFQSGRAGLAGAVAGLSVALKLYPAIACVVVGVGILVRSIRHPAKRRTALAFGAAAAAAAGLAVLVTIGQSAAYASEVLPWVAAQRPGLTSFGHPLHTLLEGPGSGVLTASLLLAWAAAAALTIHRDPMLVFAGALAISTYFAGTSWDYNLITTYPLFVTLFLRATVSRSRAASALLILGLLAIVGHRAVFSGSDATLRIHVGMQWAFLLATGLLSPAIASTDPATPATV